MTKQKYRSQRVERPIEPRETVPSQWTGYTTFRESVVISDELVVERPLTLPSAELGKVPAPERE
jgi:hypothetical protein